MQRGIEFLEDQLLAEQIDKQEKIKIENKKFIGQLENQASEAYINWLVAIESKMDQTAINKFKLEYDKKSELLEKQNKSLTTTALLAYELKENNKKLISENRPLRTFNQQEMKLINDHYTTLPDNLRLLMDAAISDEVISLELTPNPVFIRSEGKVYDIEKINELLIDKNESLSPHNRQPFKKSDVIPCNTLIKAMEHLLKVIGGEQLEPRNELKLSSLNKQNRESRARIPLELIALIEQYYKQMAAKHKVLFDLICRDPITKQIMDNPVFLPDGYVYDHSTAMAYLEMKGVCPQNSAISFKKEDITPCYFVIAVLEQLKQNITSQLKLNNALINPSLSLRK